MLLGLLTNNLINLSVAEAAIFWGLLLRLSLTIVSIVQSSPINKVCDVLNVFIVLQKNTAIY